MTELKDALHKSRDTATGPDEIHHELLKHLGHSGYCWTYLMTFGRPVISQARGGKPQSYQYQSLAKTHKTLPTTVQLL